MKPTSSRDFADEPQRKDTERGLRKAEITDADKSETKDRDKIHGDGTKLGIDDPATESSDRD